MVNPYWIGGYRTLPDQPLSQLKQTLVSDQIRSDAEDANGYVTPAHSSARSRSVRRDVIADPDMDSATPRGHARVDGLRRRPCSRARNSSGALTDAALADVEIRETHCMHEHPAWASSRARKALRLA